MPYLGREGRGWNNDVMNNTEDVLKVIWNVLGEVEEE
jgi:very-short-patch-repair endonuclease